MNLRFASRGGGADAVVHLAVLETLRFGNLLRRRGEALCRPATSLPNLEPLALQAVQPEHYCEECITVLARLRLRHRVNLPPAAGVLVKDLLRRLRSRGRTVLPRPALAFTDRRD